jgi:hypothetical protein
MGKKQSNPPPPKNARPAPPPGPPSRKMHHGFLGVGETKESIRAREDYEVYMCGWSDGFNSRKGI